MDDGYWPFPELLLIQHRGANSWGGWYLVDHTFANFAGPYGDWYAANAALEDYRATYARECEP